MPSNISAQVWRRDLLKLKRGLITVDVEAGHASQLPADQHRPPKITVWGLPNLRGFKAVGDG